MKRLLLSVLFIALQFNFCSVKAQQNNYVMAYKDYRNYLFLFKDGISSQLESQPVRSFQSKGEVAGYVSSANNLVAYTNGEKTDLGDATGTSYDLTNNLLIYKRDEVIGVFDNGKLTRLTYFIRDYKASDALVAFRDQNIDVLKVYYKGSIQELETTLIGSLGTYKVGKNTVAYMNSSGYFKVFNEDQTYELDNIAPVAFEPGKNIVVYIDGSQQTFNAFYNAKVLILEQIKPLSFKVGDDLVAYTTDEGFFKVFTGGKLVKVESFAPDFYSVNDATVLFFADSKLQVLQYGIRYQLSETLPKDYQMSRNSVAWRDQSGRLYLFSDGKVQTVTSELFSGYQLSGNIIRIDLQDGASKIYYNGKTY